MPTFRVWGDSVHSFEMQDRAIHLFRAFATSRNVHVTIVIHPRKEDDSLPLSIRYGPLRTFEKEKKEVLKC